jgi:hypothetical protein
MAWRVCAGLERESARRSPNLCGSLPLAVAVGLVLIARFHAASSRMPAQGGEHRRAPRPHELRPFAAVEELLVAAGPATFV